MTHQDETLRRDIRAVVAAITPWDPVEADAQASVLRWIDSGAELFRHNGSTPPRHLAVFFALLDDTEQSILQIHHVKAGTWLLPGGHVDAEPPQDAVLREAAEELGIHPDFHPVTGTAPLFVTESQTNGLDSHTDVSLWYVLQGRRATPVTADPGEISDVRWVRLADAAQWALQCHSAHQVLRFATKLTALTTLLGSRPGGAGGGPVAAAAGAVATQTAVADGVGTR